MPRRLIAEEKWRGGLIDTYEDKKKKGKSLMSKVEALTEYLQRDMTEVANQSQSCAMS